MASYVRILVLLWADVLAFYTMWVMQTYLTDVWKLSITHAAGILNIWGGITRVLPIGFIFLIDALLGNYLMLLLSSIAYSVGMGFLAMSTPPVLANSTGTCKQYDPKCVGDTQKVLYYAALALLAVGIAGHVVSLTAFQDEQKNGGENDDDDNKIIRIIGLFAVAIVSIVAAIAIPYIKPWSIRFGIPAICTVVATVLFLSGSCKYKMSLGKGSPLTNVCRVFVASICKMCIPFPLDATKVYQGDTNDHTPFTRTRALRCLEKAAIILPDPPNLEEQKRNKWRLRSVRHVEDAKILVRMIPMWLTFILCGVVSSVGNTYFLEQAKNMDRSLGKWKIPLPMMYLFYESMKPLFKTCYERYFDKRPYAPSVGIAVSMILSVLCCITAARIELRRLRVIRRHNLLDKPHDEIPMSIFWLLFQFFLLAGLDTFFENSSNAFFTEEAPPSMVSYLKYSTRAVSGLGFMGSVLAVYVVGRVSEKGDRKNWFQYTLNRSRLDRYYWVLAALCSANLLVYIFIACIYKYKDQKSVAQPDDNNPLNGEIGPGEGDQQIAWCCC